MPWLLASGFWLLASGFWLLASGFWLLASGFDRYHFSSPMELLIKKVPFFDFIVNIF